MKDSKSILLLLVSILLILVSFTLLWTWRYDFPTTARESPVSQPGQTPHQKASVTATDSAHTKDSLSQVYLATIRNLEELDSTWARADSLQTNLDLKLSDFYKLRNEIAVILKNPRNSADIDLARVKINELQRQVDQLRGRNSDVESENRRLYAILQQLTNERRQPAPPIRNPPAATTAPAVAQAATMAAMDMKLTAFTIDDGLEHETYRAQQVERFVGSFTVKSSGGTAGASEIFVVVVQPDNKVLQASTWETGRFETKDGRKVYSCKLKFEHAKDELKKLSFALNANKFLKGTYTMQLYSNGSMIGKTLKTLI